MFMKLSGREALVVGGGSVGTRKVMSLLAAESSVTVVSREVTDQLRLLIGEGKVTYIEGTFLPEHLDGKFLCVSAVNDHAVNEAVARACREREIPANVVDDPVLSDFFFPSVISRGDLVIAISSGGVSPSQVKEIRKRLEGQFGSEYGAVFRIMGRLRELLMGAGVAGERLLMIMERAAALPLAEMLAEGKKGELSRMMRGILSDGGIEAEIDPDDVVDAGWK